jgi:Ca-activated chloride channel family protein
MLPILLLASAAPAAQQNQPAQTAQEETPVFRGGVALVKVDAQVTDRSGRVITGLTREDFTVFDQNEPQQIAYFGRETEPLDLLLLLDVSGSMHRFLEELAGNASGALKQLFEHDRVALMLFARRSELREEFTNDFAEVQREIRESVHAANLGSGTAIYDSVIAAAQYLRGQPPKGRRAILIVTDNMSLSYKVTAEDVIRELYGSDAVLNGILIGKQRRPDPPKPGAYVNPDFSPSDIYRLAEETGGEAVESRKIGQSFPEMIERIRARYSIQYPAPEAGPGQLRHIRVELTPQARKRYSNAVIRARAGYYTR